MKRILILRHGKSDWQSDFDADHERPLAKRGRAAARQIGWFLSRIDQIPDLVLSSTAIRARRTAELAIEAGRWQSPLELSPRLYDASAQAVTEIIRRQQESTSSLLLVGHQPTWSELLARLSGAIARLPTAALARIDFDIAGWADLEPGTGTLIWLVTPKLLLKAGAKAAPRPASL